MRHLDGEYIRVDCFVVGALADGAGPDQKSTSCESSNELDVLYERVIAVSGSLRSADTPDATAKSPVPTQSISRQGRTDLGEQRRSTVPHARPQ
jgi:hypothetical protein